MVGLEAQRGTAEPCPADARFAEFRERSFDLKRSWEPVINTGPGRQPREDGPLKIQGLGPAAKPAGPRSWIGKVGARGVPGLTPRASINGVPPEPGGAALPSRFSRLAPWGGIKPQTSTTACAPHLSLRFSTLAFLTLVFFC